MSKYIVTDQIYTLDELYKQKLISHRGKTLSKGWFGSWQLRYAYGQLSQGQIYKVKLKGEQQ